MGAPRVCGVATVARANAFEGSIKYRRPNRNRGPKLEPRSGRRPDRASVAVERFRYPDRVPVGQTLTPTELSETHNIDERLSMQLLWDVKKE